MAFCLDNMSGSQMVASNCSQVQFLDIPDVISSTDAKCSFKIGPLMTVKEGDKIGLFMVGWSDVNSCNLFVPLPTTALSADQEDTITVSFDIKSTDIREEEFYQFCYVTVSGAVRGISSAFEIIDRADDYDLVIINPSEAGYMSISSCGVSIQEWQKIMDEKRLQGQKILELEEKLTTVIAERDHLIMRRDALDRQLLAESTEAAQLQANLEEIRVTLSKVEGEVTDLRARLGDAEQARDAASNRVVELEEERMQLLMKSVEMSEASNRAVEVDAKLLEMQEKLMAAVAEGDRVKDTVTVQAEVVEKLSAELEQSKSNEHAVQVAVKSMQQQLEAACSKAEIAKSDTVSFKMLTEEQATEISKLRQKVNDLEVEGASSFALQSAISTLKERLKKTQAELRVKEAELKNAVTGSGQNAANETLVAENKRLSAELTTVRGNVMQCSFRMLQANATSSSGSSAGSDDGEELAPLEMMSPSEMDRHLLTVQKMSEKNYRDAVKYKKLVEEMKKTMASKFAQYEALWNAEKETQQALRRELSSLKAEQASRLMPEGAGSVGAYRQPAASAADEQVGAAAPPSPRAADPDVIRTFDPLLQPPPRPPPPRHSQQGQGQGGGQLQAPETTARPNEEQQHGSEQQAGRTQSGSVVHSMSESFIIRSDGGHICPICRLVLPKEIELQIFRLHVDSHYDKKCPMCEVLFKFEQQSDFERHVQSHFNEY